MSVFTYPPSQVYLAATPIIYNLDGSPVEVGIDNATPVNTKPLPSAMMIRKDDGNYYPVTLDTTNPYAHTPVPVVITDISGTSVVNVTASDLNVSIKHNGADPSSVRVGNGTNVADVNASNELLIHDADSLTQLTAINASTDQIETKLDTLHTDATSTNTKLDTLHTDVAATNTALGLQAKLTDTQPVSAASLPLPTGSATEAKQDTGITALGSLLTELQLKADLTETQPVSVASLPLPTGSATEAKQDTGITALGSLLTELQLKADLTETQPVSGTFWQATQPISIATMPSTPVTGTFWQATQPISVATALPISYLNGTITQIQLSVGLTAVRATVAGTAPSATRKKLIIKPSKNNTGTIYFGASTVTTSNGMEAIGPDRIEFLKDPSDYYLISDTAAQVVEIVEVV